MRPGTVPGAARARGASLIVFLLVLVLLSAAQLLRGLNQAATATGHQTEEFARSGAALREAKQALLGAAVAHEAWRPAGEGPGHFSCAAPSTDLEADGTCGSGTPMQSAGFFPLSRDATTRPSLPRILDGSGTPLVFVMDTHFSKEPARPIHLGHTPRLLLDGQPVVALLFAPGAVRGLTSAPGAPQSRQGPFAPEQYLEDPGNIDGDVRYVTPREVAGNDLLLAITHRDLLCAIRPRVRAARVLQEAFNLNPASPPPPAWYGSEGWNDPDGAGGTRGTELDALDCG